MFCIIKNLTPYLIAVEILKNLVFHLSYTFISPSPGAMSNISLKSIIRTFLRFAKFSEKRVENLLKH